MLFSSVTFLYWFLPALLAVYFIVPKGWKNAVLLAASLLFYAWGEPVYVLLMIGSTLLGWLYGLVIEKFRGKPLSKIALIASIVTGIGALAVFKYSDFFINTVNSVAGSSIATLGLALPIGISFYTFQILSYTIDLYRGNAEVQRSIVKFGAYVTLFPQLIAGPIVRYTDIAQQLDSRQHSWSNFASGATRFVIGLGKKVLLANTLAELVSTYRDSGEQSVVFAWLYVLAYSLHIYFDFSGYSDMAIGLGRIFGFKFVENFNYPYISKSITEFWRRWHISLGSWFRDYVYIPLGGNRVKPMRHVFNILAVWVLTGFWHGAGWTFMAWGLYFGLWLLAEKFFLAKWLNKLPAFVSHIYTALILAFGWVLFDASSIGAAAATIGQLFGAGGLAFSNAESLYYLRSYGVVLLVAAIGCTPLPRYLVSKLASAKASRVLTVAEPIAVCVLLVVITAYLVDGSFNPFIYFRF